MFLIASLNANSLVESFFNFSGSVKKIFSNSLTLDLSWRQSLQKQMLRIDGIDGYLKLQAFDFPILKTSQI
jgi:hypothetical protein